MSVTQHLRVIGSRRIFQFFLPPAGDLFPTSEFLFVEPGQAGSTMGNFPDDDSLTIVVDPDDYEADALASLRGVVWLWFLRPLFQVDGTPTLVAPRLAIAAEESLIRRRNFLERVIANRVLSVVVSDTASYEYCVRQGYDVHLSPPPVSDVVSAFAAAGEVAISVLTRHDLTEYTRQYLEVLPTQVILTEEGSFFKAESPQIPSHWVVPKETLTPCFPYEAAIAVVAGQTLISEALSPRWGLEAGLDYIEYSTPEELRRIVEHLARYPQSTHLMSWRGKAKSQHFSATRVYRRLFSEPSE
ncbi:hypothetical protein N9H87_01980 [Pontimonas sp.]|nr:hypothetical protein [Pontimonas sp.]MDA8862976.1 hypothetical protein [Pontimonas sp.]